MKILNGLINVLTTLIIVVGGIFLILYLCGFTPYVVLSGSMEPTIETGSLCFINRHAGYENVKGQDIIAYRLKDNTLVTHRVVEINEDGMVTKGDANKDNDATLITSDNYMGKNVFWIPKVGYLVKVFQTTTGKIIIITCIVILFVAGFLFGEDKKKNKELDN